MLLSLFLCYCLILPIISGSSTPSTKDLADKIRVSNNTKHNEETPKTSNFTIITEGGITVQSSPVSSSKQNQTDLLTLDTELGKDKVVQESSSSKVKPRKGVEYPTDNSTVTVNHNKLTEVTVTHGTKKETQALSPPHIDETKPSVSPQNKTNVSSVQPKPSTKVVVSLTTPRPRKPLILSNELLDKMAIPNMDSKTSTSLHGSTGPSKMTKPMSANRHPGMVMPIVITILVVPMFAVLGYMALRRGQEAWKNRHYKRMDFLLDGMYNE